MKRVYLPGLRTLDDLRARCTIDQATGCWAWTGRTFPGGVPALPLAGESGSVSLQIALAVLTTGKRLDTGRAYIPTCGNMRCLNLAHRREGSRAELHQLVSTTRKPHVLTDEGRERIRQAVRESWEARKAGRRPKAEPKPKPAKQRKARPPTILKPTAGVRLHDKLDRMGQPGVMPQNIAAALRKPGSSARTTPSLAKPATEATITSATRITVCPSGNDQRYTVRELPPGYRSALDPRECRAWAESAVGGRAA